ncbi:Fatty acid oxidation complex subunit alpha [Gossypium arboreum]|uniref:Fatty acid oxidation complex subunit alpha n=1 Tax=Gossypium arboreum TaxID=29729 RepID=A0A0B0NSL4_GOSAR|nr:Fatty acid oxidation complex subunit alpha [Gossypium arboreum]
MACYMGLEEEEMGRCKAFKLVLSVEVCFGRMLGWALSAEYLFVGRKTGSSLKSHYPSDIVHFGAHGLGHGQPHGCVPYTVCDTACDTTVCIKSVSHTVCDMTA